MSERYAEMLRARFPDLAPDLNDLFLLEAHQIANLPQRAPARELAAVLHADPRLRRFLVARHPAIGEFVTRSLDEHGPASGDDLAACERSLVWELADWIVYQRAPEMYDSGSEVDFDVAAVVSVVDLEGKVVIDAGAGTGRVAFAVAPYARHVFAFEPVATLRQYMRDRAERAGMANVFVADGLLSAIPLPAASADVLLTCQAIGWSLDAELMEIERVVRPGGVAMHLFGTPEAGEEENPLFGALGANGYEGDIFRSGAATVHRYQKRIGG